MGDFNSVDDCEDREPMKPLVCYHADCADGFCAAWSAWQKLKDGADYLPVQYGQEPPDVTGREVFILDFSFKRPVMERLRQSALTLTVLDHHKTAQAELDGFGVTGPNEETNVRCVFDMGKSGGRLAWEFFCPGRQVPWLVDYTEDRDLWAWKLPRSREISAAVRSYPFDFERWNEWAGLGDASAYAGWPLIRHGERYEDYLFGRLITEGAAILRYQQQLIDAAAKNAVEINLDGHKVLSVNATCLMSEIGERLADGRPFAATFFIRSDGKRVWSLRSRGETGIDVSEVARRHGGGGHKAAAGFTE